MACTVYGYKCWKLYVVPSKHVYEGMRFGKKCGYMLTESFVMLGRLFKNLAK